MSEIAKIDNGADRRIDRLDLDERANIAHDCTVKWAEGWTYTDMAKLHNIAVSGVKALIAEHAAYVRQARPDTKTLQEEEYRRFYGQMKAIEPEDSSYPALVRAKAIEARLQIMTRQDKLFGHEIIGEVEGAAQSVVDLARKLQNSGDFDGISPFDLGVVGEAEDIEDAEIVEDEHDGE